MTKITYPNSSPYALTPQSNFSIGRYSHRKITASEDDVEFEIEAKYHHRPDLLAYELYGNSGLYWVFMLRNMNIIRDPLWGFEAGLTIYRPTNVRIQKLLNL